jgi:antitoxin VapB
MLRYMPYEATFSKRHLRLFRNGRNQAVRIPREFELPGEDAIMRKEGERLIIKPTAPKSLPALLASQKPLEGRVSADSRLASGTRRALTKGIGGNDLLIAAQALALGCTIVTDNEAEFARIDSLPRENWLRQPPPEDYQAAGRG